MDHKKRGWVDSQNNNNFCSLHFIVYEIWLILDYELILRLIIVRSCCCLLLKLVILRITRSSHQRCSMKKVFFKISQNSQENACVRVFVSELRERELYGNNQIRIEKSFLVQFKLTLSCYWYYVDLTGHSKHHRFSTVKATSLSAMVVSFFNINNFP